MVEEEDDKAGSLSLRVCCCCMSLHQGTRTIGTSFFFITLGIYATYLVFIEDLRDKVLDDLYHIKPCTVPPIDTVTDVTFEYSIIANLLLVVACVGCSRWLLVPWLVMYFINILFLLALAIWMFVAPLPLLQPAQANNIEYQMLRCLGFIPLILCAAVAYFWLVIRSLFIEMGSGEKQEQDVCCPIKMKTGVQIIGGVLSILSGVVLVLYFAKLDSLINVKYQQSTGVEMSRGQLTLMAGSIVLAVMVNILLILGGSGKKWRRALVLPWLLFYGAGIIFCLMLHLYYTSLCWREEKIIGMVCLGTGFSFLVLWSVVWIVAAEMGDKQKTIISRPNPLGFQRL